MHVQVEKEALTIPAEGMGLKENSMKPKMQSDVCCKRSLSRLAAVRSVTPMDWHSWSKTSSSYAHRNNRSQTLNSGLPCPALPYRMCTAFAVPPECTLPPTPQSHNLHCAHSTYQGRQSNTPRYLLITFHSSAAKVINTTTCTNCVKLAQQLQTSAIPEAVLPPPYLQQQSCYSV